MRKKAHFPRCFQYVMKVFFLYARRTVMLIILRYGGITGPSRNLEAISDIFLIRRRYRRLRVFS